MCVCYKSSVKKLDLNQKTRFTILVYSTGFRIMLPALISLKSDTKRQFYKKHSNPRYSIKSYKEEIFSNTPWLTKIFRLRLRYQVAPASTGNNHGKINLQYKATMMLHNWPVKFRPTRMWPWKQRSLNYWISMESRERTPLLRLNLWHIDECQVTN